jgi:hydrogenase maturation factor
MPIDDPAELDRIRRGRRLIAARAIVNSLRIAFLALTLSTTVPIAALIVNESNFEEASQRTFMPEKREYVPLADMLVPKENRPWLIALAACGLAASIALGLWVVTSWNIRRLRQPY